MPLSYWKPFKAEKEFPCGQCFHTVYKDEVYFQIEMNKSYLNICLECFTNWVKVQQEKLKREMIDWNNILGKCEAEIDRIKKGEKDGQMF